MGLYERTIKILTRLTKDLDELKKCMNQKPDRKITEEEFTRLTKAKNDFTEAMKNFNKEH